MAHPYLPDAPWPSARGGLGNAARRDQQGAPAERRFRLPCAVTGPPLVGPGDVVEVVTVDGRRWRLDPAADRPRAVELGASAAAGGCLDREGRSIWPLVDGTVVALAPDDTVLWRYALREARPTVTFLPTRALRAPLALGLDGTILAGSDDTHLYAIRPDGVLRWASPLGLPVRGSPAVTPDGGVLVGGLDATVVRLDPATGRPRWRRSVGHAVLGGVATDGARTAVVGTLGGRVVGLDVERGRILWTSVLDGPVVAPPACLGATEGWVVATLAGQLVVLSPTGRSRGTVEVGGPVVVGPVVGGDGTIVVGTADGAVRAWSTDGTPRGVLLEVDGPRAIAGLALGERGPVAATTAGEVMALSWSESSGEALEPAEAPAQGAARVQRLHVDEPALVGALDPLLGVGVQLDLGFFDAGGGPFAVGRWSDVATPGHVEWLLFDVDDGPDHRRLTTDALPIASWAPSARATLRLPGAGGAGTWTFELAPDLDVPDPASALLWAASWPALLERAGKPFVAMREVLEGLWAERPSPGQLAAQVGRLPRAVPRWLAAASGLADPGRWRVWRAGAATRGAGRLRVSAWAPPPARVVVDHVRLDRVRRRIVAEVGDAGGEGVRPGRLAMLLVRDGSPWLGQTTAVERGGVVTDLILELPLDLVIGEQLEVWVLAEQQVIWKGPPA